MLKTEYPYQLKCHDASIDRYAKGVNKQLITIFTGGGKTFTLIRLIEKLGFKKVLWLSFQEELVSQSAMAFIKEKFDHHHYDYLKNVGFLDAIRNGWSGNDDFKIGCIKADIFKLDANVVMGSVMTVARRLDKLDPNEFDCVICDEAHLFMSQSAVNVLEHFKPKLLLGCTATPHRADGLSLGNIFDEIVFEYGLDKGIKDGYAAELDAIKVTTNVNLDAKKPDGTIKVRTTAGDFNNKDLSDEVNTLYRNQLIVNKWKQYGAGRQTIAFCVDITHAIDLAECFKENGIKAVAVSSDEERTPERSENINKFKNGEIEVITNVGLLVAGFDHPDTGCAIMGCPTKSLTKYLQSVGRIARLKGKDYVSRFGQKAIVLDIVDSTTRHNLVNAWELDREKDIEDRVFVSREKKDILIAERLKKLTKLEHQRDKDEQVSLLSIPKYKINFNSDGMRKPATQKQLGWIKRLGYNVANDTYTMAMIQQIVGDEPASRDKVEWARSLGYDVSGRVITNNDIASIKREIWIKEKRKHEQKTKRNN